MLFLRSLKIKQKKMAQSSINKHRAWIYSPSWSKFLNNGSCDLYTRMSLKIWWNWKKNKLKKK
jgi:hypothetical protein